MRRNAGIADIAECVDIGVMEFDKLTSFAKKNQIDMTIVGPDDPLVAGAVDAFEAEGLKGFWTKKKCCYYRGF